MKAEYTLQGGSPSGSWATIEFKGKPFELHYSHWEGNQYISSIFDDKGDRYETHWYDEDKTDEGKWLDDQRSHFYKTLEEERRSR